ncbi:MULTISPECIES: caspase family protein [Bacillus cereus group]|uniref:caspase family protein n=1 Tax=Bacillus cereus group TaxID=86661 RepID=UPI00124EA5DD|nr:caspase family protein [Bacillus cereus]KAB2422116.1 caspase family protein [Bacillus cereus]
MYKALIIAVDQYEKVSHLPNTVNDAIEIKRLLLEAPSLFEEQNVQIFHGSISRKAILQAALSSFFQGASNSDVLFLFWAGHGAIIEGEGYFVPYDGDVQSVGKSMIPMHTVKELIDQTSANTVLSFFDTCHSGAVTRMIQNEMARGLEVKGSGKVLIAACTESQGAWDRSGHGAFTDYLIRGLEGEASDLNGDVDVYNLYSYISKKLNEEFGNQDPVIKSTLNGKPLLLKRVVNRGKEIGNIEVLEDPKKELIEGSGANFLLGNTIVEYDEYQEVAVGEYRITVFNPENRIEKAIKDMRGYNKYPFAIRDEADVVKVENVDIKSSKENTVLTINLKSTGENRNNFYSEMSVGGGLGQSLSADQIAILRIRRILFGDDTTPNGYNATLIESMILNPVNSKINVIPNLLEKFTNEGHNKQKIRIMIVASLILTGTLERIETLSFTVEDNVITKIKLVGYRPKYYSNVDPVKVEIEEFIKHSDV